MAYENHFYTLQGSKGPDGQDGPNGPAGDIGPKGQDGQPTAQTEVEWHEAMNGSTALTFQTDKGEGDTVGSGTFESSSIGDVKDTYKVALSLPTNEPPTVDNDGAHQTYYAWIPSDVPITYGFGCARISDDGLSVYSFSFGLGPTGSGGYWLQATFEGGSGSGAFNTILSW